MADDDEMKSYVDAFVKKDMKDHPDCRYSLSSQKECSSNNGSFACETIRRVFRNCPGLRPEQVYDITTRDTGNIPKSPGGSSGGGGVSVPGAGAPQQWRGGIPAFGPQDIWPPGRSGMDDLLGNLHDRLNNFFKESPFAGLDADINPFGGGRGGGGGGGGGVGGGSGGGGGGGSVSVGDQSGGAEFPPHVPPPHKRRQSDPANEEQGAGEAAKGGSSVARA